MFKIPTDFDVPAQPTTTRRKAVKRAQPAASTTEKENKWTEPPAKKQKLNPIELFEKANYNLIDMMKARKLQQSTSQMTSVTVTRQASALSTPHLTPLKLFREQYMYSNGVLGAQSSAMPESQAELDKIAALEQHIAQIDNELGLVPLNNKKSSGRASIKKEDIVTPNAIDQA